MSASMLSRQTIEVEKVIDTRNSSLASGIVNRRVNSVPFVVTALRPVLLW